MTVIDSPEFRAAVEGLRVPEMGTEAVAPLLADLVRFTRPQRVLEVGMGYTTPFLAAALADVERRAEAESAALAAKTRAHGAQLDQDWLHRDPALLNPGFYREPYRTTLVAVDNLSIPDSSAGRVRDTLADLGLADRVTVVNADLHECRDLLPAEVLPIDLAWVDAWECLYFFDEFWDLVNPDGGLVVMHYLMTYPEGEAILDYIAKVQQARPGEFEFMNLLEPHKLVQNSLTVLRRTTAGRTRTSHAEPGGRLSYGTTIRRDADVHLGR
ncbi:hypothetical protein ALI22I_09830 [Saccharothrix sp. ALI-22-I]|uniref:class I SAM-dependent methyltransferase n=1 Tax=Saccharothrix sp. ALI-22-I TaxID=1933778 RepID=UPI00097C17E0|nr:class I SAM-dependent methyltransferase [Saccharothrix sp. ALI-22-I]ONI91072.1 hypothetical protein ALI22I_09830 [Saccharothrix sp. ALI-22-I]